jgi:hypothetical protein
VTDEKTTGEASASRNVYYSSDEDFSEGLIEFTYTFTVVRAKDKEFVSVVGVQEQLATHL